MDTSAVNLGSRRTVVSLPSAEAVQLFPGCELLCQEGFTTWSVTMDQLDMAIELLRQFPRRARFGVHGVTEPAQVTKAQNAGATFVLSPYLDPDLVAAAAGFPVILTGGTVSELRSGVAAGAWAVQLWPAEAFGLTSAPELIRRLDQGRLIVGGEISPDVADEWLDAGAAGIWPNELVDAESLLATKLDPLREQLHWWRRT